MHFQVGPNLRAALEGWNIGTVRWLRRMVYERWPQAYAMPLTFVLSAWWHGFYFGYYTCFFTAALFTQAARVVSFSGWLLTGDS